MPSTLRAGLRCRCPRCGEGKLFRGVLEIADHCHSCGLDFGFAEPADGPAVFVMTGVGIVVIAAWTIWAFIAHPPIWAQFAVVMPALLIGCLGTLQPVKAWLVAEQFGRNAEQGRTGGLVSGADAPLGSTAPERGFKAGADKVP